jgi:hypothetical protein
MALAIGKFENETALPVVGHGIAHWCQLKTKTLDISRF